MFLLISVYILFIFCHSLCCSEFFNLKIEKTNKLKTMRQFIYRERKLEWDVCGGKLGKGREVEPKGLL